MRTPPIPTPARFSVSRWALPFGAAILALVGCSSIESHRTPAAAAAAPAAVAARGDFSGALRCMDSLLLEHGTRDMAVTVEDLVDQTRGASEGTKGLLMSVLSDMTQRSRAIRLLASRKDQGQRTNSSPPAQPPDAYAVIPRYVLRGAIGLTDQANPGRAADTPPASVLALDLTLATQDLSVVPGGATRNTALLLRHGAAFDGRVEMRKFGVAFGVAAAGSDVLAQASRALAELASIELFGRLARVPYWTCLGLTDAHPGVAAEIQDWYDAMATEPAELIRYFQAQLRLRRAYDGPIDGAANGPLKDAVARYRAALGLSREAKLTLDFFRAYLGADHRQIEARLAPPAAIAEPVAAAPAAATAVAIAAQTTLAQPPLALRIATANKARRFAGGEAVQLTIHPNREAHVYCYLQDEKRQITRFFPNRFQSDARVQPAQGLRVPGAMRFEIVMNPRGVQETVSCFATERDVLAQLPGGVSGVDFAPLPVASLEQVRNAFARASGGVMAQESFDIRPK